VMRWYGNFRDIGREQSLIKLGRVLINPVLFSGSLNVCFAPKATEMLRCRELTRCAKTGRTAAHHFRPFWQLN
jgi:hypothetical protein